jgi:TPR repeat protein
VTSGKGDQIARLSEALELQAKGRFGEAADLMKLLADEGLSRANVHLGWMHQSGLGKPVDLVLAEKYYSRGAAAGDVVAEYYLASLLRLKGELERALEWYEKASQHGHSSASYWAYVLYSDRGSAEADRAKAKHYLEAAARNGHYFAQRDLAREGLRSAKGPLLACKYLGAYISAVARGAVAALRSAEQPGLH